VIQLSFLYKSFPKKKKKLLAELSLSLASLEILH